MNPFPNPWIAIGLALSWLASIGTVAVWQRHEGRELEAATCQKAQIQSATLYTAAKDKLLADYRAIENKRAIAAQDLSIQHLKEMSDHETIYNGVIADLRNKSLRLRDPGANHQACGSTVPKTSADPIGIDYGNEAGLSEQSSEFLVSEAKRADEVVLLLNQCISQLKADRE